MVGAKRNPCWRRWCRSLCSVTVAAIAVVGFACVHKWTSRHQNLVMPSTGSSRNHASEREGEGFNAKLQPSLESVDRSHLPSSSPRPPRGSLPSTSITPIPPSAHSGSTSESSVRLEQHAPQVSTSATGSASRRSHKTTTSSAVSRTSPTNGKDNPSLKLPRSSHATNLVICPHPGATKGPIVKEDCSGPEEPPRLPDKDRHDLRKDLIRKTEAWGYMHSHEHHWSSLKGKRVLDVGMGQGPIGVVALKFVSSYTGLDPGVCINHRPCVRNKQVARTMQPRHCEALEQDADCRGMCQEFKHCSKEIEDKYQKFDFTGVQMMQAYKGELILLPGTFETLDGTGLLKHGAYDVATLWSVTEHLPDNHLVISGIFDLLKPGQFLCVSHHNFYSYDGHHSVPQSPDKFSSSSIVHKWIANWRHVNLKIERGMNGTINHVRLGDLIALLEVYFTCSWRAKIGKGLRAALTKTISRPLLRRGFTSTELLVQRFFARCQRRTHKQDAPWLQKAVWWLPPEDGSYVAQPLPEKLVSLVEASEKDNAAHIAAGDHEKFCGV